MSDFNPHSSDATFATILGRLAEQDRTALRRDNEIKEMLSEIKAQTTKTNGRVSSLEHWKTAITARSVLIGSLSATAVSVVLFIISKLWN